MHLEQGKEKRTKLSGQGERKKKAGAGRGRLSTHWCRDNRYRRVQILQTDYRQLPTTFH